LSVRGKEGRKRPPRVGVSLCQPFGIRKGRKKKEKKQKKTRRWKGRAKLLIILGLPQPETGEGRHAASSERLWGVPTCPEDVEKKRKLKKKKRCAQKNGEPAPEAIKEL